MKLEKAIEINKDTIAFHLLKREIDAATAIKLGSEALKFRQRWEEQEGEDDFPRLPGETEE